MGGITKVLCLRALEILAVFPIANPINIYCKPSAVNLHPLITTPQQQTSSYSKVSPIIPKPATEITFQTAPNSPNMAYMLADKSAFWQAQKQIKDTDPRDPKPQKFIKIFVIPNLTDPIFRIPEPLLRAFCPDACILSGSVDLEFVNSQAVLEIFNWIKACSDSKKITPFPYQYETPFFKYCLVKQAAQRLRFHGLVAEMANRCNKLILKQLHTNDIRKVYYNLSSCKEYESYKKIAAATVSMAVKAGSLQAKRAVQELCEEIGEFNLNLVLFLDEPVGGEDGAPAPAYSLE